MNDINSQSETESKTVKLSSATCKRIDEETTNTCSATSDSTRYYKQVLQSMQGFVGRALMIPQDINVKAKMLCWRYNQTSPEQMDERKSILRQLLGTYNDGVVIQPTLQMDFGFNVHFHGWAYVNYSCTFLDTSPIIIGNAAFIAPGVIFACASHPIDVKQRTVDGLETSKPIVLGDNVWIGAHATICGGVTIGEGSIVGANALVLHDIPAGVIAAGVPAKVIRKITEADKIPDDQIIF